jgi:hypothetical protein
MKHWPGPRLNSSPQRAQVPCSDGTNGPDDAKAAIGQ